MFISPLSVHGYAPVCPGVFALGCSARKDPSDSYSPLDRLLFQRFADSVVATLSSSRGDGPALATAKALTFANLISDINQLTMRRPSTEVHNVSKRILVGLFPQWLLPAYKSLFGAFPGFSAWMNAWVTHWTTTWLMGPSKVMPLDVERYGSNATGTGLLVEKVRPACTVCVCSLRLSMTMTVRSVSSWSSPDAFRLALTHAKFPRSGSSSRRWACPWRCDLT